MPELPEVETIVQDLRPLLQGRRVDRVDLRFPAIVRHPEPEAFVRELRGRRLGPLTRRGKYMLLELDAPLLLVVHLGMTGQLLHVVPEEPLRAHTHAILSLDDGTELRYRDVRRFGRLLLGSEAELVGSRKLPKLGPEPIDPDFKAVDLYHRLQGRKAPLKLLLLDQAVVAGVGNIYADESCFRARVRPDRPAGRLSRPRTARLHAALRDSLLEGILNRGSSVADYVDARGAKGRQQEVLLVYGRGGEPCFKCGRPLAAIRLGGRMTVFCRTCQR
ncbi:MAG: bifunctional DNA-formamidopyrimidine glycosylase/DNA-(apurinic or apyrimidinic site) lyase [Chloroflexi bacterium]|nr:MAG: bifunctional DNA-formamidopyrimidine glycosylase/DNA-(apurinic or apyrimidinic site) lyase [Chloroflexota bacterium]TME19071.1 MAG: bifunctional DNA-formamidopyrimidine glycosylase/DNA-(apurinic or apyrimidinic site) lyase [Chloroflexota bacterium]